MAPIAVALDALHDSDVSALTFPPSGRRYDQATLDRLFDRLIRIGARVRGQIDRQRPSTIENLELLDYRLEYRAHLGTHLHTIVAVSKHVYPTSDVKDRTAERHWPDAAEPSYRVVVRNLEVETAPLVQVVKVPPIEEFGAPTSAPGAGVSRGGHPEIWNWPDLADRLRQKPFDFESRSAFEEWCRENVLRVDGKSCGTRPEIKTVQNGIRRHRLDQIGGVSIGRNPA
jgi:hypothetical protein